MASRVNTKFVVTLLVVLVLVFAAVGGVGILLFRHSASDRIAAGDKRFAEGKYRDAMTLYAKGVNKEPTNVEYVRKWQKAIAAYIPENRLVYEENYRALILTCRQIATLLKTDVAAHREYYDLILGNELAFAAGQRAGFDAIVQQVSTTLASFADSPDKKAAAEVLRRYRGLAGLRVLALTTDVKAADIDAVREDLEAALKADPADDRSAEALVQFHELAASRAARDNKPEDVTIARNKAIAAADTFLAANPRNPRVLVAKLYVAARSVEDGVESAADRASAMDEIRRRREPLKSQLDEVKNGLVTADAARIDFDFVQRLQLLEAILDPDSKLSRTESVVRRVLEARPADADFLVSAASILADRREYAGALEHLKTLIELPPQPVSLAGSKVAARKVEAGFMRCAFAVRDWDTSTDAAAKAAALARAKAFRDELAKTIDAENFGLTYVNAQIAFAEGDMPTADRLLRTYNTARNEADSDGLWLAAQVAMRINPPRTGEARRLAEKVLQANPGNAQAMLMLAEIETRLQNVPNAITLLEQYLRFDPQNKAVADRLATLKSVQTGGTVEASDPVVTFLSGVKAMYDRGEKPEVITAALRKAAVDTKQDRRIVQSLASQLVQTGDRVGALEVVREALKVNPNEAILKSMEASLSAKSELEGDLAVAELNAKDETEKAIRRYQIYRKFGKPTEALAALEQAAKLEPEDSGILELQFIEAIESKNLDQAAALGDKLTKMDADRVRGETYRARLQAARGDLRAAIQTVEEITSKGTGAPEIWRLLGRLRLQNGRLAEAVDAFDRAIELRPDDAAAINELIQTMMNQGRAEAALARARELERFGRNDATFTEMLLTLEGAVGDKAAALSRRRQLAAADPANRANLIAMTAIEIDQKLWDAAKRSIDNLRSGKDDLQAATLLSRWNDAQNNTDGAKKALTDFIARQDESKLTAEPFLTLAQYLAARSDFEGAMAAFEKARAKQDPKLAEADKLMCDVMFAAGRPDDGIEAARRVVRAGADTPQKIFQKRLVEALIRRQRVDEAEQELATLADTATADPAFLLLTADIRTARQDDRGARNALDDAVAKFGDNAMVLAKRASWMSGKPELLRDAKADLDRAVKLSPRSAQLLQLRANVSERLGQTDDAIADLKELLRITPTADETRDRLIVALIALKRPDEAATVADQNIADRRNDPAAIQAVGQVFARNGEWPRATSYFRSAFDAAPGPATAGDYVTAMLNTNPPPLNDIESTLRQVQDRIASDSRLSMLRARLLALRGKRPEAKQLALDALKLMDTQSVGPMLGWYTEVQRIISDNREMIAFLDSGPKTAPHGVWLQFFKGNVLFNAPDTQETGLAMLKSLTAKNQPEQVRQIAYRTLSIGYYQLRKWMDAVDVLKAALAEYPDDFEFNNNLAFILAKHLDRGEEALPYAEKISKFAGRAPEALDTLGVVYWKANRLDDARRVLAQAAELNQSPGKAISVLAHLGQVLKAMGNRDELKNVVKSADELLAAFPTAASDDLKAEIDTLR